MTRRALTLLAAAALVAGCPARPDDFDYDGDGSLDADDCSPMDPAVHDGADDPPGDGLDTNCDGVDGLDADGDGWAQGEGDDADCDDGNPLVHPGAAEVPDNDLDEDCDGDILRCDRDGDGLLAAACGGQDCDDLASACGLGPTCADDDGDGFRVCEGDCDDADEGRHPGADELCDGVDTDCDGDFGAADEADADADGYRLCDGDCDDGDPTIRPDAPLERCDGADTDCDGDLPADELDGDGDGWLPCAPWSGTDPDLRGGDCDDGEPLCASTCLDEDGDGVFVCAGDCDDGDPSIGPQVAEELCDGLDTDCDGTLPADETDGDGDGWLPCAPYVGGDPSLSGGDCDDASATCTDLCQDDDADGARTCDGDCDDGDPAIFPGNWEDAWGDGIDSSCDGWDWWSVDSAWAAWGHDPSVPAAWDTVSLGGHLASLGDLDGDGLPELAFADPDLDFLPSGGERGGVFVVWGDQVTAGASLVTDATGLLEGDSSGGGAGLTLRSLGDLDGDGLAELAVGEPAARVNGNPSAGRVSILTGAELLVPGDRSLLDAAAGQVEGPTSGWYLGGGGLGSWGQERGWGVAGLGDLDGDGTGEVAVASWKAFSNSGRVWLFDGAALLAGGGPWSTTDATLELADPEALRFGWRVTSADLDGDGLPELLIDALAVDPARAQVRILSGADLAAGSVTTAEDAWLTLEFEGGSPTSPPTVLDDLDGDGLPEIAVGYRGADALPPQAGFVCLWSSATLASAGGGDVLDCPGDAAVTISGVEESSYAGFWLVPGDLDGDGLGDLVVLDEGLRVADDVGIANGAGGVHIFRGSTLAGGGAWTLYEADGTGFLETGWGFLAAAVADVNGDGADDLLVGARDAAFESPASGATVLDQGVVFIQPSPW